MTTNRQHPEPEIYRSELVTLFAKVEALGGWGYLRFEESTGFVSIASDYGHWTVHFIPRHRSESLGRFLSRIDMDYAANKFLGLEGYETDREASRANVRDEIIDCRKNGHFSKEEAREEWEWADFIVDEHPSEWMRETRFDSPYEMLTDRLIPAWRVFWQKIWEPAFRPLLKDWPFDKAEAVEYERSLARRPA